MDAGRAYRVGRDPTNDIVIEHSSVSRHHCELRVLDDGAILLNDCQSMNGTAVRQNGQWEHIEQATVERDERILLGEIVTTVGALMIRAPKTPDREPERHGAAAAAAAAFAPAPRRMPLPTTPARPAAAPAGLIDKILHSEWARLHRRSDGSRPRRDGARNEPSISLPAIAIGPAIAMGAVPEAGAASAPTPLPLARFTAPGRGAAAPDAPVPVRTAAYAPPMLPALAEAPGDAAPPPPVSFNAVRTPRSEPDLLGRPMAEGTPVAAPDRRAAAAAQRARWRLPIPGGTRPAVRWAVLAGGLLVTTGVGAAAYLNFGGHAATHLAAAEPDKPAEAAPPGHVPAKSPGDRKADAAKAEPAKAQPGKADTGKTETGPAPGKSWPQTIEGTPDSVIAAAAASRDGLCLAGTSSLPGGGLEAWVLRLDGGGKTLWQRRPGGPQRDAALAVAPDGDGGCVAAGYDNDETRLWIFRLDAKGVVAWNRSIPAGHRGRATALVRTRDGGYAVAAYSRPAANRPDRAFVLRLSPRGEIRWSKYAGAGESAPSDIRETPDGGFIVAGAAPPRAGERPSLWAARLDRDGKTNWERTLDGPGTPLGARVDIALGRDFVIAASMTGVQPATGAAGTGDALRVARLGPDGAVLWDQRHATAPRRTVGLVLVKGGIVVAGDAGSTGAAPEFWLAQLDAQGGALREQRLPALPGDRAAALAELRDGRMVLAGTAEIDTRAKRGAGLMFIDRNRTTIAER